MEFYFKVSQKEISSALNIINTILAKSSFHNENQSVKFVLKEATSNSTLEISFIDSAVNFWIRLEVKGKGSDELYLPVKSLSNFINSFPGEELNFKKDKNNVTVTAKGYEIKLLEVDSKQSFAVSFEECKGKLQIENKIFREIIRKTSFCIIDQKIRRNLVGMNINYHEDRWYFVGTDAFRISIYKQELITVEPFLEQAKKNIIVAKRSLDEIAKILDFLDKDKVIDLQFDARKIIVQGENLKYKTMLVDDEFPDIKKHYNRKGVNKLTISAEKLVETLRIFKNNAEVNDGEIIVEVKKGKIIFISKGEKASIYKEVESDYKGEEIKIGFNVSYLLDAVQSLDQILDIDILFGNKEEPVCFKNMGNNEYTHILMPLRLEERNQDNKK